MTAQYSTLREHDPEAHHLIGQQIRGQYLDGDCYEFALALSEGLGWPMVGIIAAWRGGKTIRHVVLQTPSNGFFDARGFVSMEELGKPFGLSPPYTLTSPITREDVETVRPINMRAMRLARRLAESYWPKLPWQDSLADRALDFALELEALSRKHNIWLFGYLPTTLPGLSESDGEDEAGYTVAMNATGLSMSINRRFK